MQTRVKFAAAVSWQHSVMDKAVTHKISATQGRVAIVKRSEPAGRRHYRFDHFAFLQNTVAQECGPKDKLRNSAALLKQLALSDPNSSSSRKNRLKSHPSFRGLCSIRWNHCCHCDD